MSRNYVPRLALALLFVAIVSITAQTARADLKDDAPVYTGEEIRNWPYTVWFGSQEEMSVSQFVSYCAPVLWFSPDEPLLEGATGRDIRIPLPFPFEESAERPVVYYRLRSVVERADETGRAYTPAGESKGDAIINLKRLAGIDLDFFFYYDREEGLNAHEHDVESVEMKIAVARGDQDDCRYAIVIQQTLGKAHGVLWYDNTLISDAYGLTPVHIIVEEAKHASCTDKNGDGMYTPGYDVNTRINDAWGVRDIIRSGNLFAASWQSWMAKVRFDDTRVFPPLPGDSPRRAKFSRGGVYSPDNAVYEVRPFPTAEKADEGLKPFIADKGDPNWPEVTEVNTLEKFLKWTTDESWTKSFAVALRYDGHLGVSFVFPFWIVRNLEDPIGGGYILHRLYLTGEGLDDLGYMALYTPSASRWIDPYFGAGFESRKLTEPDGSTRRRNDFAFESGFKFRVNIVHTPFKLVRKLGTDFWGLRLGVRYRSGWEIQNLGYVVEIGAGSF